MKLYQWVMPILGLLLIPMSASAKTEERAASVRSLAKPQACKPKSLRMAWSDSAGLARMWRLQSMECL